MPDYQPEFVPPGFPVVSSKLYSTGGLSVSVAVLDTMWIVLVLCAWGVGSQVIGTGEVEGKGSAGGKDLEVSREDLPATATSFPMLHLVEEAFQLVVGSRNDANAAADLPG